MVLRASPEFFYGTKLFFLMILGIVSKIRDSTEKNQFFNTKSVNFSAIRINAADFSKRNYTVSACSRKNGYYLAEEITIFF